MDQLAVTYDIIVGVLCARTLPAIMAKMKKAWGTEKRINGAQRRDMEFKLHLRPEEPMLDCGTFILKVLRGLN